MARDTVANFGRNLQDDLLQNPAQRPREPGIRIGIPTPEQFPNSRWPGAPEGQDLSCCQMLIDNG